MVAPDRRPVAATACCTSNASTIDGLFGSDVPSIDSSRALAGPVMRDVRLAHWIRVLHAALDDPGVSPLEHQARVAELLLSLFAAYGRPPRVPREIGDEEPLVSKAKDYLADHLSETVRLLDVAVVVGLSPFYFLRAFKRSTGMPPHAWLNQLRLERARALLRAGESPTQTAAALSFVDQSHLTRRFKAAFGVTPGQYRAATPKGRAPALQR